MTTKQTKQTGEQTLLLAGIPLEKAEAAREALAEIGITFTPKLRTQHHSTREHLEATFQATDDSTTPPGAPISHQGAPRSHLPSLRPRRNHRHPERLPGFRRLLPTHQR